MKKHLLFLLGAGVCATALLSAGEASAQPAPRNDWYLGLSGDLTWMSHSTTGGGGNVDLGYRFSPSNMGDFRLEGEAGYHGAGGKTGYSSTHYITYMGNLYYDFNTIFSPSASGWHVVPYIGGGLGDAAVHVGHSDLATTFHHHENDFAYQGMAGLTLVDESMPNTDWSVGYRYLGTDGSDVHSNSLELGVRFHF